MTKRPAVRTSRALRLLGAVIAFGGAVAVAPALAAEDGAKCEPGSDCTGFERNAYEVREGAKFVHLNVFSAFCCPAGQGQIDYATFDGSAIAGKDYQRSAGTLTYAGHGASRIQVPIVEDTASEGDEQFVVKLTDFRGSFVERGYDTAVVTVRDRAQPEPESEPVPAESSDRAQSLRTGKVPATAAPQPIAPTLSPSESPPPSQLVSDDPGAAGVGTTRPPRDRSQDKSASAPVVARRGGGGTLAVLLAVLAGLSLAAAAAVRLVRRWRFR